MKTSKNNKGPKYDFDRLTQHLKINKYNILMVYFVTSESQDTTLINAKGSLF